MRASDSALVPRDVLRAFADVRNWVAAIAPMGDTVDGWCGLMEPRPWTQVAQALDALDDAFHALAQAVQALTTAHASQYRAAEAKVVLAARALVQARPEEP